MIRTSLISLSLLAPLPALAEECVILLHGLARTDASMGRMETMLEEAGYQVVNQGYPSRSATVRELAEDTLPKARAQCDSTTPHVVTHSMGAILLRSYAAAHPNEDWGRVVMLGPPNHGSEIIDTFGKNKLFIAANGPASLELGTDGLPGTLPPVPFETGVIAGNRTINPLLSYIVEGEDDGKVSIAHTKVAGMKAHLTLPVTHTFMMRNKTVIAQVLSFLKTGTFSPNSRGQEPD